MFSGPKKNESAAYDSYPTQLKIYQCQLLRNYVISALLLYLLFLRILVILCIHASAYLLIVFLKIL